MNKPLRQPSLTWYMKNQTWWSPILPDACPFCGKARIVVLPPPLAAKQPDGTTHVCHPSIGGCNYGFQATRPFAQAELIGKGVGT
jgi:hypothetical protein